MKITVELDEFWMDNDSDGLSEDLNKFVKNQVTFEIWKKIENKVKDEITNQVSKIINSKLESKIEEMVKEMIVTQKMKSPSINVGTDGMCTIAEKLKYDFEYGSGWLSPLSIMKDLGQKFSKEMKDRYDTLFASQIVLKMNEQGLLKDGVVDALLKKDN